MELQHDPTLLWFIAAYAVVMIGIGIFTSRKVSGSEDFVLAGKTLGPFVLMGTLLATWTGSGSISGGETSMAFSYGIYPALLLMLPTLIGIIVLFVIAPKIREYGKFTVAGILEAKYGTTSRNLASVIIVLAYVGIVSYQMQGLGFILNLTTGMAVETGTIIGAVMIIFLAMIGGLRSVSQTDAISGFLMVGGLIIAVPTILIAAGGWEQITANVPEAHMSATGGLTALHLIGYLLPSLFLLLGDQNMYQRLASSKGDRSAKRGQIGWFVAMLVISPSIAFIAFASRSIFPDIDPGMALMATTLVMPVAVSGLLLAAAASFIITTGNSFLLSAATNVTYDVYKNYINKDASDKRQLWMTRIFIVVLGALSFVIISYFPTVLSVQMYAYTVYGAGVTPAVLAVFFWKKVNAAGGISSMVAGVATTLIWEIVLSQPFDLNAAVIAVPVAFIVLIAVTLMTQKPGQNDGAKPAAS
ncbi:sodium:solute symporter family protein [Alteribacter natronophilus]|uniref:sodium:solute symporter family protein n=1 Tax=Alteribacter natronophilus TaxID=2583810 RepID=UPI00110EA76A|nr:sodium:solute symporter family protein [Alteribacter natronophilus]TMW71147.1 sodium:solute symporter family protein [Alteribacter natronophilus]